MMGDPVNHLKGLGLGWIWSGYNLVMLSIALLILLDAPRQSRYESFNLQRVVRAEVGPDQQFWGFTTKLSEAGAEIALTKNGRCLFRRATGLSHHPLPGG